MVCQQRLELDYQPLEETFHSTPLFYYSPANLKFDLEAITLRKCACALARQQGTMEKTQILS